MLGQGGAMIFTKCFAHSKNGRGKEDREYGFVASIKPMHSKQFHHHYTKVCGEEHRWIAMDGYMFNPFCVWDKE